MARVYLGLGSNLGGRVAALRAAIATLRETAGIEFVDASRLYETEPWESEPGRSPREQAWYLNCAVAIDTTLRPDELLDRLQTIESGLGRDRPEGTPEAQRFAPRTLDIDILLFEDRVVSVPDRLQVPHLLLHERAFVLRPLADLAADIEHPTLYRTIRDLLAELEDEHSVERGPYPPRWFDE